MYMCVGPRGTGELKSSRGPKLPTAFLACLWATAHLLVLKTGIRERRESRGWSSTKPGQLGFEESILESEALC